MRRTRPSPSAAPTERAAATGSRGSPSARGNTLVPPPGRKPKGTPTAPFSASLYVPSPEKTTIASTRSANAAASSVAWPGRCVNSVSSSTRSRSARSTAVIRLPVTCVEYGLTIRTARFTLTSMPRTALIVAVPEAEHAVAALRLQHDSSAAFGVPAHLTILFPFLDAAAIDEGALEEVFAGHDAFDFELVSIGRSTTAMSTWHRRTGALRRVDRLGVAPLARPAAVRGAFDRRPHLTISERPLDCAIALPIAARADVVTLIEEQADGRWLSRRRRAAAA